MDDSPFHKQESTLLIQIQIIVCLLHHRKSNLCNDVLGVQAPNLFEAFLECHPHPHLHHHSSQRYGKTYGGPVVLPDFRQEGSY